MMAKEAGVVKSVNGGIARALNDLTGEVRQLSVGDIVYQGEKIVTEGSNSKVTITQTDGKDITLIGKDTLTLDQDSNNNETVADISALQQAILKGTDLNALEETAAGGPQAGGNSGDGVSLSSTSFAEGGHISNIYANVEAIDALALAAGGDNSFGVSGGNDLGIKNTNVTTEAPTFFGGIELSSSFYSDDISNGYFSNLGTAMHNAWLDSAEGVAQINDMKEQMKSALENVKQPYPNHTQNAFTAEQIDNLVNEYANLKSAKEPVDSSNSANLTNTNNLSRLFDTLGTQVRIGQKTIEIDGHQFQKATASIPEESIEKIGDSGWGLIKNAAGEPVAVIPIGKIKTGLKLGVGNGEIGNETLTTSTNENAHVISHGGVQKIFTNYTDADNYMKSIGMHYIDNPAYDPMNPSAPSIIQVDSNGNQISSYQAYSSTTHTTNLTTLKLPASTLANLRVFGSDGDDTLMLDGVTVKAVYGGSGADNITVNNSTITEYISGDAGNDNITVNNSTINGKTIINSDGLSSHEAITGNSGQDTISVTNSNITGKIDGGADNDKIEVVGTGIKDGHGKVVGDINGGDGNDYINVMTDVDGNINAGRSSDSGVPGILDNHSRYHDRIMVGAVPTPGTSVTVNGNLTADGNVLIGTSDARINGNVVANSASNQSAEISLSQNTVIEGDVIGGHGRDFIDIRGYHDGTKNAIVRGKVDAREGDDRIDVYNGSVGGQIEGGKGDDMFNLYKGSRINGINDIEGNSQLQVSKTTVDSNLNFNGDTKIEVVEGGNILTDLNLSHNNRISAMGNDSKITGEINLVGDGKQFVSAIDGGEIGTVNLGNGQNEVVVGSGRSGTYQDSKIDNVNGGGGTDTIKAFSGGTINNLNIQDGSGDDTISRFSTESYDDMGQHTKGEGVINHIQKDSGDNEIHGRVINKMTDEGEERHIVVDSSKNSNIDLSSIMEHGLSQNHAGVVNHVYDSIDVSSVANAKLNVNIADVLNVPEKNHGIGEIETVLKLKYGSDDRVTLENNGSKNGWHEIANDGDASNKTYKAELDHDGNTYSVIIKVDNDSITPDI